MPSSFTGHVLVPVADAADARETAQVLTTYEFGQVTVLHVVEKTEGAPDKMSLDQAEQHANEAFAAFREILPDADAELAYRSDIVDAILAVAEDVDASAIVFRPRGGSRLVQFLSGDVALRLLTDAERPVIAVPEDISP